MKKEEYIKLINSGADKEVLVEKFEEFYQSYNAEKIKEESDTTGLGYILFLVVLAALMGILSGWVLPSPLELIKNLFS